MRKGWVLLLVLALGAALAQVRSFEEIKRSGEIRIGTEGAFPPFNYFDERNQLTGFEVDLGNAIAERLGLKPSTLETRLAKLGIKRPQKNV